MGPIDYSALAKMLMGPTLASMDDPREKSINPLANNPTEGAFVPRGGKIEYGGKRYWVRPVTAANGQVGHTVQQEVKTGSGGTTWRTISGYGRADRRRLFSEIMALFNEGQGKP